MIYIIPYFVFYRIIGLIDSVYGLILINTIFTIPLVIWLLISFFEGMPISIEESAMIEGANKWQILTKISIPIAAPGIVSCAILTFIFSWNEFIFALILTNRHAKTAPIAIVNYMAYEGTEWGKVAAAGIFILLPVLIFSILIRKYLIQSVVGSGVKE
jgi:multiple sugar transport system permease protein